MNTTPMRDQPSLQPSSWGDYSLIDFGDGRKLEAIGNRLIDRPAPVAAGVPPEHPGVWPQASSRYECRKERQWAWTGEIGEWQATIGGLCLELRPTGTGQTGVFPEQIVNWEWIRARIRNTEHRPVRVLNLFAYTGGTTLAAAQAGAEVVHVDAQQSVVDWARRNAQLSGLGDAPVRWIVDDAQKFVLRELRRGRRYDAVVLDPPTYGHGPRREVWQLARDLAPMLQHVHDLLDDGPAFVVCSCHTTNFNDTQLESHMVRALPNLTPAADPAISRLVLSTADGRSLESGIVARWTR